MYLSRLLLNPRSRQAQREAADPYELHRTLMRAFVEKRDESGVLHRLDVDERTGTLLLLVQSQVRPDWGFLAERDYLLPADPFSSLDNPAVKPVNLPLRPGQLLNFRLRANPTVKRVRRDGAGNRRNSNRRPLLYEKEQVEWLHKQAHKCGFCLVHLNVSQSQQFQSYQRDNPRPIELYTVQFDGRLQVMEPATLCQAVIQGVGPARAFGCGLLSLAPPRSS